MVVSHPVRNSPPSTDLLPWLLPELRARAGLTQQQLADRLGSSLPTVQRLESGTHPATMQRTWELADALGLRAIELVALVDAASGLGDRDEVPGWLDGLAWLPSPGGPLQRPALSNDLGQAAPPATDAEPTGGVEPAALLRQRVRILGLLLGQLRARAHLPVAELANLWGPSASTVKRFQGGRGSPDLRELAALGVLLGLTRTELVSLAKGLLLHLGQHVPRRKRPEVLESIRSWLDSFQWVPNPGEGLLASRPAGHRWEPTRAAGRSVPTVEVEIVTGGDEAEQEEAYGSRALLREELARPAALALAEPLLCGWSVAAAALPPVQVAKKSLAAVVAAELMQVLEGNGWPAWPALLVRPGRAGGRRRGSPAKRPPRLSTVAPGEALIELGRGSPLGPWRLVIVEGLDTLDEAGLGRRQPGPQLQGAALVVLQTDPAKRTGDLSHFLGRRVDFSYPAISAMDAGLLPGLRYRGVRDPVPVVGRSVHGGLLQPGDPTLRDDRRLEALADAGAFVAGRSTLVHVVGDEQEQWVRSWLQRHVGARAGRVLVARRSSERLRFEGPLDEVVLLGGYPATRVGQVFAALRRADIESGLDVWSLETPGIDEAKRRGALAGALGAAGSPSWRGSDWSWCSPKGRCTFEWLPDPPGEAGRS